MRRRYTFTAIFALLLFASGMGFPCIASAAGGDDWDISGEIRRLYREAPSISAYPSAMGVVWLDSYRCALTPDGAMEKTRRFLMLMGQYRPDVQTAHVISLPQDEGASLAVAEAAWYNPMTGMKEGTLPVRELNEGEAARLAVAEIPREAEGRVIAIVTRETRSDKPYFDDVLSLAGAYPAWEQSVTVDIPDGMDLYWQGEGVREPIRRKGGGRETITWTLMNQPAWQDAGIVDMRRPSIAFSLRRGPSSSLRALQEAAGRFQAPPMPSGLRIADRTNLAGTGEAIAAYMAGKSLNLPGSAPEQARTRSIIPADGPWTLWEQTLIARKWLEGMGYPSEIYWNQLFPVSEDGPDALGLWTEPLLIFRARNEKERDLIFKAGQGVEFGRIPPSLCGRTVFQMAGGVTERFNIPAGSAAENTLVQAWKLALDEKGLATGTLELSVTGGWVDALALGRLPAAEDLAERLSGRFIFNAPGLALSSPSVAQIGAGYRVTFAVSSALGIVSGGDILMRVPSAAPQCLDEIASAGERYSLRFPFALEQRVNIATPEGYRVVGALPSERQGDSKATLEVSMFHWPRRGELEISGKWTVREPQIDETLSRSILGQHGSYVRWSQTTLPLRKR